MKHKSPKKNRFVQARGTCTEVYAYLYVYIGLEGHQNVCADLRGHLHACAGLEGHLHACAGLEGHLHVCACLPGVICLCLVPIRKVVGT